MSPDPYQTYHCFHNCWCHLVVELDTCACLWRCFLDIGEKAKYICGKQIGTSGRWMGWWRQIGEKAPNKLEQYRRSCIHTEALLEIFMVNKSTLYSDVMAPNMLARPPRGKYGADEEKIILFPVATTSHREAATTNNGCHHRSARVIFSFSRWEWEFLLFNLAHRDKTENFWHLISGFETRPRKNLLQSQASRRDRDLLSSFSGFETRTRILLIWSRFSRREREF